MNLKTAKGSLSQRFRQLLVGMSILTISGYVAAEIQVGDAWVRATVPGQQSTGAFMTLTADSDSKLVGAASPAAKIVQIHQSTLHNDVMSMHEVKFLALPAGKTVKLGAQGYHVMLMNLKSQIKEGDRVPLTLTVENARGEKESIQLQVPARALSSAEHDMMN
ncbi:copper chaperone PCu(A)C [Pseudomonas protegens]|uniref:copper chaperone PCu(A)C n=1 Tax=Pseudomonas protegens TaxID=380021 RepID=UPI003906A0A7